MLIGFDQHVQDYPASTQHFHQADGTKFFHSSVCDEAKKCRLCLQRVLCARQACRVQYIFRKSSQLASMSFCCLNIFQALFIFLCPMSHLLCTSIIQAISSTVLPVQDRRVLVALGLYMQHVENGLLIHGALPTSCRSASVPLSRSTCGRSTVFDMNGHMPMRPTTINPVPDAISLHPCSETLQYHSLACPSG